MPSRVLRAMHELAVAAYRARSLTSRRRAVWHRLAAALSANRTQCRSAERALRCTSDPRKHGHTG